MLAYHPGDLVADILDPDHPPFEPALGRGGPAVPYGSMVRPWEISSAAAYDHGDYFPPSVATLPAPSGDDKWRRAVAFMASAYRGQAPSWP
jgi:hypothetical protein